MSGDKPDLVGQSGFVGTGQARRAAAKPGARRKQLQGKSKAVRELSQWLRDIADAHGMTLDRLDAAMTLSRSVIAERMNPVDRHDWSFVDAFVTACTQKDLRARESLRSVARQLWKAADPALTPPEPPASTAAEELQIRGYERRLEVAGRQCEEAQRMVDKHQQVINALMYVIGRLSEAHNVLVKDRELLRSQVDHERAARRSVEDQLRRLTDIEARMMAAEEKNQLAEQQLAEAHQRLARAQLLRSKAVIQQMDTEQVLADAEQQPRSKRPEQDLSEGVMTDSDQVATDQVLDNVRHVLDESVHDLDRLENELNSSSQIEADQPPPSGTAGYGRAGDVDAGAGNPYQGDLGEGDSTSPAYGGLPRYDQGSSGGSHDFDEPVANGDPETGRSSPYNDFSGTTYQGGRISPDNSHDQHREPGRRLPTVDELLQRMQRFGTDRLPSGFYGEPPLPLHPEPYIDPADPLDLKRLAQKPSDFVSVVMPQMGEDCTEGTVTRWLKRPGEPIETDEPLLEISTDKIDAEIPSPASGTLSKVVIEEGETVEVGTELARIRTADRSSPHTR
jgi:hypothetical protein